MSSISNIIEQFILDSLENDNTIELSRNEMAKFFDCVPSQINYVLNTRFTLNRGYVIESVRGGSGYIKVFKIQDTEEGYLTNLLDIIENEIDYTSAMQIIKSLNEREILTDDQYDILQQTISPKSLQNPINIDNSIRAKMLKQIIIYLLKNIDRK